MGARRVGHLKSTALGVAYLQGVLGSDTVSTTLSSVLGTWKTELDAAGANEASVLEMGVLMEDVEAKDYKIDDMVRRLHIMLHNQVDLKEAVTALEDIVDTAGMVNKTE